jgi:gliding motility-associated-like protein
MTICFLLAIALAKGKELKSTMMKLLRLRALALTLMLLAAATAGQAKHIVGGVITYKCLGNGKYDFTMKIYRDCNCTGCANFDDPAFIAIYNCSGSACNLLRQTDFFLRVNASPQSVTRVPAPNYPCLIPPNVCVEEAIYRFQADLPLSPDSYHVTYQRCCRNETINNIVAPDDVGATYTIEITPQAQQLCNNSPEFDDFPPIVICAGSPLEYDHSATDPEGDQLVYSFCAPLVGGGPLLQDGLYQTCSGAQPLPSCPPPYSEVAFVNPAYSPIRPMGGDPIISIDPNTGMITGTPTVLGQFVVGVCVEEFRNGELLSRVFRDFQFNVARCDPTVVAQVTADEVIDGREYLITSCGENTITFGNQSFQRSFIDVQQWSFDINGQAETSSAWEPTITFPDTGTYLGTLILNPGTICGDTANIRVQIFPEIEADFSFSYDTCTAGPALFTDASVSGSGLITNWDWDFGDGGGAVQQNPVYIYRDPGNFPVTLTVTDINGCQDARIQALAYFPIPELLIIAPSSFIGCEPAEIFFDNLSFPISDEYDILWEFGDGGTGTEISPTYVYEQPGTYTVSLNVVSPLGCQTDTTFNSLITVLPSPIAGFSYSPRQPSNLDPIVNFMDESQFAANWLYLFGDGRSAAQPNPSHTYRDTGLYEVMQIVTHPSGCRDTAIQLVDVRPEVRYFLPNAFTPNDDGSNDIYVGAGVMAGARNFSMTIWNRWGEQIFESDDPFKGWNGRKHNTGEPVPSGVYPVLVTFLGPRGEPFEIKGIATVVR